MVRYHVVLGQYLPHNQPRVSERVIAMKHSGISDVRSDAADPHSKTLKHFCVKFAFHSLSRRLWPYLGQNFIGFRRVRKSSALFICGICPAIFPFFMLIENTCPKHGFVFGSPTNYFYSFRGRFVEFDTTFNERMLLDSLLHLDF